MTMMGEWIGQTAAAVSLVSAVPQRLRSSITQIAGWSERRAVTNQLASMSDHELADIGLGRGQIDQVFGTGFAQEPDTLRRVADAQQERMLADLGLSGMLFRPAAGN